MHFIFKITLEDFFCCCLFCCNSSAMFARKIQFFHPKHFTERWGVLLRTFQNLIGIEELLRLYWDRRKIGGKHGQVVAAVGITNENCSNNYNRHTNSTSSCANV